MEGGQRRMTALSHPVPDHSHDLHLVPQVQALAERLLAEHPDRVAPLVRRWIGARVQYADV